MMNESQSTLLLEFCVQKVSGLNGDQTLYCMPWYFSLQGDEGAFLPLSHHF